MATANKGKETINHANRVSGRNCVNGNRRRKPVRRRRRLRLRKWVKVTMLLMLLLMALMMASSILRGCGSPKTVEIEAEPALDPAVEVKAETGRPDEEIQADIEVFLYYREVVGLEDFDVRASNQLMKELIESYRISLGGAAGISGNAYTECRYDPGIVDEPEWYLEGTNLELVHVGIFQWEASARWPLLEEYMEHYHLDKYSIEGQLRAAFYSLDASGYQWLFKELRREDIDPTYAAKLFQDYYEVALEQATEERQDAAVMAAAAYRLLQDGIDASTL